MARRQNVSNELILELGNKGRFTPAFAVLMAVSGILTAVAFLTNSVPVLIGAMVIAPALPPLALVVFAVAGGQPKMALRGAGTILIGICIAVLGAVAITLLLKVTAVLSVGSAEIYRPLLEERVRPGWYSAIVALAAGTAGVLGTTKRRTDVMIGTVAAVALVPAGCACGISLVAGDTARAGGALVLLVINLLLIAAAGFLTIATLNVEALD